ncbi:sodium/potassium-transporting ATPase subunit alpha-A [Colletotrichum spaethianum]|uniref:Sodium/potassium-transporting ATPase subunit alpha-A n=1 Tax=Colletotrichum spaethianum TaxID=700344 RepID=A0AA37LH98_9PEZI|nr:sodium/potassium-transporting ATPase subunit alpha-A [Colletotrichum spaethianum]GKT46289.1 sodium/potassium-transporting ATPase subunit alpha-A [Colletotrichum spaethianum]
MHSAPTASLGGDRSATDVSSEKHGRPENDIGPGKLEVGPVPLPKSDEMEKSSAKDSDAAAADASDLEVGTNQTDSMRDSKSKRAKWLRFYRKFRLPIHVFVWMLFTAWWIVGLVFQRDRLGWLKPFLVYLAITIRIVTLWLPASAVMVPLRFVWKYTVAKVYDLTPKKLHQPLAALLTIGVFLVGSMIPEEVGENTRASRAISLFGLLLMIGLLTLTSRDWRKIPWHTVIGGMLTQFIIALLYHCGFLQWFIKKFAVFFFWSLRVSGAEAVVATATPFIGQGESAMLIKPFVPYLTLSEIHQVMTCGFATIAGSVLVGYIGLGLDAQVLVSSCVMSIPASIAVSKLRYPETEESLTKGSITVPEDDEKAANAIHAFANGAWFGLKVAGMIVATLLCIISFVALINGVLGWFGKFLGIDNPPLTLQLILGYVFYPVAWCLGVPNRDLHVVGELIGIKIITNEFVAFNSLSSNVEPYVSMSPRSKLIATYACCGFGNIGSLGTQIGVLSQIAPGRAGDVSRVALSALFAGVLSTLTSASVAGMLYTG